MKINVALVVKGKEEKLLALSEGRQKSLVPVLGGGKIIDYYLQPIIRAGVKSINVICDREMEGLKDYILYSYANQGLKVLDKESGWKTILSLIKLRSGEGIVIIRADNLLFTNWPELFMKLHKLSEGNYTLNFENHPVGLLILEPSLYNKLKNILPPSSEYENLDGIWKKLLDLLVSELKPFHISGTFIKVLTPYDYYSVHMRCLEQMDKLFYSSQCYFSSSVEEGSASEISRTGYVRDSYIAPSCIIDGKVERSVIFPHVRVGKSTRVVNSIILENNYIGNGAVVTNTILCDHSELFSRMMPNIGEGAVVGEEEQAGSNSQYPDLIYGGFTLIGKNVGIPRGMCIPANCYITSGVDRSFFKGREKIKPGECISIS